MADPFTEALALQEQQGGMPAPYAGGTGSFMESIGAGQAAVPGPIIASLPPPQAPVMGRPVPSAFMNGFAPVPNAVGPTPPSQIEQPEAPLPLIQPGPSQQSGAGGMPGLFGLPTRPDYGKIMSTGGHRTVESAELSKEQKRDLSELTKLGEERKKTAREAGEVENLKTQTQINFADELLRVDEEHQKEDRKLVESQGVLIKKAQSEYNDAVKERQSMKMSSLLSRMPTGKRIGVAILQAFGGLAGYRTGSNVATDALRQAINDDFALQQQAIQDADQKVLTARTGIKDAEAAKEKALVDLWRDQEATLRKTKTMFDKLSAQAGAGANAIATKQEMQNIDANILAVQSQAHQVLTKRISDTTNRARVHNAASAGAMMMESGPIFDVNGRPIALMGKHNAKTAQEVNDATADFRDLRDVVGRLKQSYETYGYEASDSSDASQQRLTDEAFALGLTNKMLKYGALDKGAQESINRGIKPSGMSAFMGSGGVKLDEAASIIDGKHKSFLNSRGLPADQFFAPMTGGAGQGGGSPAGGAVGAPAAPSGGGAVKIVTLKDGRKVRATQNAAGQWVPVS